MNDRASVMLDEAERLDWLRLIRSENVGPVTFRQLLARFGSAGAALEALPDLAKRGGGRRAIRLATAGEAERELEALTKLGGQLLASVESAYSPALAALDDAPPVLCLLGQPGLLQRTAVALVGARNASANGRRLARDLAQELGQSELVIVSGLARGIDASAHQGALASGTVAVMAGGVDVIYPPENDRLYEEIKDQGLLLSEIPLGTEPQARHFPRRNRLISGLSKAVLVVEAAVRSGSLITARYAGDQGRDVLAVPGSPLDPRARGCNRLLKDGAILVETSQDVLDALPNRDRPTLAEPDKTDYGSSAPLQAAETELAEVRGRITELLGPSPVPVDELIRECQLSPAVVMTVLLELELAGRLERHPGNRVALLMTGGS